MESARVPDGAVRVVVVDDESNITELVALGLRYEGFAVLSAGDGRAALRAVREFKLAAAILDVMLPDIDGFEICPQATPRTGTASR